MRILMLVLGLSALGLASAAPGLAGTAPGAVRPAPQLPETPPERPGPRDCAAIEADAARLLANAQVCSGTCEVASFHALVGDSCVGAFQCTTALPADVDLDAFAMAAKALDAEKRACGECAQAACVPPEELEARCVEGRCELTVRAVGPEPRLPVPR